MFDIIIFNRILILSHFPLLKGEIDMIKHRLKIVDIIDESKGTKTYILEKPEDFNWEAGAMTHVGLVGFDEGDSPNKGWVRHMSICSLPSENHIAFTTRTKCSSEFKERLAELTVGDELILFKTVSHLSLKESHKPLVMLTMGVGIAAVRPLIISLMKERSDIPTIQNITIDSSGEFIFKEELDQFCNGCLSNHWFECRKDFYDRVNQTCQQKDAVYYVIGSDEFIINMILTLRQNGIEDSSIVIDKRQQMLPKYFQTAV